MLSQAIFVDHARVKEWMASWGEVSRSAPGDKKVNSKKCGTKMQERQNGRSKDFKRLAWTGPDWLLCCRAVGGTSFLPA